METAWKPVALVAILLSIILLAVCLLLLWQRTTRPFDERLIGVWQSDAERTINEMPDKAKQVAAFRDLFGKMRVTHTATSLTTELDGIEQTVRCEVLGSDKSSVVVRLAESSLGMSEFAVFHFDGRDAYWVYVGESTMKEYFKKVR